jgi:hypothetical protein
VNAGVGAGVFIAAKMPEAGRPPQPIKPTRR